MLEDCLSSKLKKLQKHNKPFYFQDTESKLLTPPPSKVKEIADKMLLNKIELVYAKDIRVLQKEDQPHQSSGSLKLQNEVKTTDTDQPQRFVRKMKVFQKPYFVKLSKPDLESDKMVPRLRRTEELTHNYEKLH